MEKIVRTGIRRYCFRCTGIWSSGTEPETCPFCGRHDWDEEDGGPYVCLHCGHEYGPDGQGTECPRCEHPRGLLSDGRRNCRCLLCGHFWTRRDSGIPDRCPECRNASWNTGRFHDHVCMACGHRWRNGIVSPRRCPACYSVSWNSTLHRFQCRRCGHRWRTARESESVTMCPSCKSRKWNEPPVVDTCLSCGSVFPLEGGSRIRLCPVCKGKGASVRRTCTFCGVTWSSARDSRVCPRCGTDIEDGSSDMIILWSEGNRKLVYSSKDGSDTVYLFAGSKPVASKYLSDVLDIFGCTVHSFLEKIRSSELDDRLLRFAMLLEAHRDDYLENIPYFMDRLDLGEEDARILALHFTSMGPEAISLALEIPLKQVRGSFDRIMLAYQKGGIVVDDSVYTDDPFEEYRKQLGE